MTMDAHDGNAATTTAAAATALASPVLQQLLRQYSDSDTHYIDVDGPVDASQTLIRYDAPYALHDAARTLRARQRVHGGDGNGSRACDAVTAVDDNVRVVLDAVIAPRRWRDADGVVWLQHASPRCASRLEAQQTHARYRALLQQLQQQEQQEQQEQQQQQAQDTQTTAKVAAVPSSNNNSSSSSSNRCDNNTGDDDDSSDNNSSHHRDSLTAARALLNAEAHMEVMRQVVCECWPRGLLLLHLHNERVAAQVAHRELLESRLGHALRLALKGERDAARVQADMTSLHTRLDALAAEEQSLRAMCDDFATFAEEQMLIEEKQHNDAVTLLRRDAAAKRAQLEAMIAVPPPM